MNYASIKTEKSQILSSAISNTRNAAGRFIKQDPDTKRLHDVGDFVAKEKISQIFHDVIQIKKRPHADEKTKNGRAYPHQQKYLW